jgi:two-component system OmpR family response regulator
MFNRPPQVQRIFLVEDSPIIRDSLIDALDDAGHGRRVVGTADTEDDALAQIADTDPDVAIIDINLRKGTGIGVLTRLAGRDDGPRMRIVYTNQYNRRVHEHCARLGATHVLPKGGDLDELIGVLEEH